MWKCVPPWAAICGRWVMQTTWNRDARRCSLPPTTSATAPPMPASTSSKISVLPGASVDATVLSASMILDNSPPETMRARGRSSSPGFGEMNSSACSVPSAVHCASLEHAVNRTSHLVRAMARSASERASAEDRAVAASRRRVEIAPASDRYRARADSTVASMSAARSAPAARSFRFRLSSAAVRSTSSRVGPCFFLRRSSSASRSSTSWSRWGDTSIPAAYDLRKNAKSSSWDLTGSRASRWGANRASIAASSASRFQTTASAGQHRLFPLVEGFVGVGAETPEPVCVRQDQSAGRQLVIFSRRRADPFDLGRAEM